MAFDSISPIMPDGAVSLATTVPEFQLGTRGTKAGIDYVYIYNDGGVQISQGMPARVGASVLGQIYSVTVSNAASQVGHEMVVGVAHNATIATGQYGFIATRGPVYIALDGTQTSMNSGDLLALGIDGGFVVAAATLSTGVRLGYAINSIVTTVGTGKGMFRSPIFG